MVSTVTAEAVTEVGAMKRDHYSMIINGDAWRAIHLKHLKHFDPAKGEVLATVVKGNQEDAEKAVKAARNAFEKGKWSNKYPVGKRARILNKIAAIMRERF